jgi:hypothetical protein
MLAMNRCLEISMPTLAQRLFEGLKSWLWLGIAFLYGILSLLLFKTASFSGIHFAWFLNPHVGYFDDIGKNVMPSMPNLFNNFQKNFKYDNPMAKVNNVLVFFLLPGSYVMFIIVLIWKKSSFTDIKNAILSQKKACINIICNIILIIIF